MSIRAITDLVPPGKQKPDYYSTLSTRELQAIIRETHTLPLENLVNLGRTEIDIPNRRIWRDSFWKGSFARDTLLGWEERVVSSLHGTAAFYTGGRFWKRFDKIQDGRAYGHVVNYGVGFLPGKPVVMQLQYPDNRRSYVKRGDDVLLLRYRNAPYHAVYDVIKLLDRDNCIGVMHLGRFPTGIEFSTFVMTRNNYPFVKMAVPDHDRIFAGDHLRPPVTKEIVGSWRGYHVWFKHPDADMKNQFNLPLFRVEFTDSESGLRACARFTSIFASTMHACVQGEFLRLVCSTDSHHEICTLDGSTMLGRRIRNCGTDGPHTTLRYVLIPG